MTNIIDLPESAGARARRLCSGEPTALDVIRKIETAFAILELYCDSLSDEDAQSRDVILTVLEKLIEARHIAEAL
jgi:hypothetical protein